MLSRMKDKTLPRLTPDLAKSVWQAHRRPSARRVARALNQAGYPIHYTTIGRWRSEGWREVEQGAHPIEAARIALDSAVPILTGEPTTTSEELVNGREDKGQLGELTDKELLRTAAREALITHILIEREFHAQLAELVKAKPMETGVLIEALAALSEAATGALQQALAPKPPTG